MERDSIDMNRAVNMIKSQFPLSEKLKVADYTIDTSGSREDAAHRALETFYLMEKSFSKNINGDKQ